MTAQHSVAASDSGRSTTLMGVVNARVAANAMPGSNAHSGWLAAIRAGITPAGELLSVAQAAPWLRGNQKRRSAELRAAAIRAINKDTRQSRDGADMRLGHSFARLHKIEGGTSVAEQVGVLPLLNVDGAALVLNGLVGRCAAHGIPVNFYGLVDTLVRWGSGSSAASNRGRNQIVLDFHQGGAEPLASH